MSILHTQNSKMLLENYKLLYVVVVNNVRVFCYIQGPLYYHNQPHCYNQVFQAYTNEGDTRLIRCRERSECFAMRFWFGRDFEQFTKLINQCSMFSVPQ